MKRSFPATLRRGRAGDLDALLAIERAVFTTDILSRRSFRHFLTSPNATLVVAEDEDTVIGCALVLYRRSSKLARLYSIAVDPAFWRRGLARQLLTAAEKKAAERGRHFMRVEVRENNLSAIDLYQTSGYSLFGRLPRYYGGRIDGLRFEKSLRKNTRQSPGHWRITHKPA